MNGEAVEVATNQTDAQMPIAEKVVRVADISSFMRGVELEICEPRMVGVTAVSVGNPTMISIHWGRGKPTESGFIISFYNWTARRHGLGAASRSSVFRLEQQG